MIYMMMIMNFSLSMTFLFLNHPLSMGMILMIQTLIISLISGMLSYSFWFSYILFLIMIGGMLILFLYMTSLASNEFFKFSKKISIMLFLILTSSMIIYFIMDKSMMNSIFKFNSIELINQIYKNENLNSLNLIYNNPNFMLTFLLINYLLLTLIAVVKITHLNQGPLRQKF